MSIFKTLISAALFCAIVPASGCTREREDQTKDAIQKIEEKSKDTAEKAADKTKEVASDVADKTKEVASDVAGKTKEVASDVADKSKKIVSATGEAITDGWITTKVKTKLADEKLLKDTSIKVETNDRVVTLTGGVGTNAAKVRAGEIAGGTEGVARVDNKIVVKAK